MKTIIGLVRLFIIIAPLAVGYMTISDFLMHNDQPLTERTKTCRELKRLAVCVLLLILIPAEFVYTVFTHPAPDGNYIMNARYTEFEYPSDVKGKYLYTYGLLQALFLQQDAAKDLSASLLNKNINFRKEYPALYQIREIRNDATGHPTNRGRKDDCNQAYVQITQISMHKDGFRYAIYKDTNNFAFEEEHVDLSKCIEEQSKSMQSILAEICDLLDEEWRKHLEKFKDEKMVDIFKGLDYARQNVLEDDIVAEAGLEEAANMVKRCKSALNERYGDWRNIDCFRFEIEDIEEIFSLLGDIDVAINSRVDHYLSELLFIKIAELEECAKEIDEKFNLDAELQDA